MAIDPINLPILAQQSEDENWRFRAYLKLQRKAADAQLDQKVFKLTRQVWSDVDCTKCANCCKAVSPTLSQEEVDRLAQRLGLTRQAFIEQYLEKTEAGSDNPWVMRTKPCPFLMDDVCSVYEDRPGDCAGYPYLYKPNFSSRTMGMIGRTFTCPIVYEVIEKLKREMKFRDHDAKEHQHRGGRRR